MVPTRSACYPRRYRESARARPEPPLHRGRRGERAETNGGVHTLFGGSYERTAHHDPIGDPADRFRMLGTRDAESDSDGKRRGGPEPGHRRRQVWRKLRARAGYSETADQIYESASVPRDLRHSVVGRRRRDQPHKRQGAAAEPRFTRGIRAHREVGHQDTRGTGRGGTFESVRPSGQQGIKVS